MEKDIFISAEHTHLYLWLLSFYINFKRSISFLVPVIVCLNPRRFGIFLK